MPVDVGEREGMGNEMSRGRYGDGRRIEEKGKRGRAAVMRVVNNHLRFDGACAASSLGHY